MRRLFIGFCSIAVAAGALAATTTRPASASSLPSTLTIVGHGWGHGRGMGQYGAYGYSQAGWSYTTILNHYYGGTSMGSVNTATVMKVRLSELDGLSAVTVKSSASGTPTTVKAGAAPYGSTTTVTYVDLPGIGWRPYKGRIQVLSTGSSYETLNLVAVEDYVRGVVPAESPASWGAYGGQAALQAQAVAARSYAWAYTGGGGGVICDTTWCQVYTGDPDVAGDPGNSIYTTYTDQAQATTAGQVRVWPNGGGAALTEFSSSTGGYTAGGAFPAVVDAGDATPSNPNHSWSVSIATSSVQSAFPSVGTLQGIAVTGRNGLGDLGGRVTQMVLSGSAGQVTVSGAQFAGALGLMSDWFAVTNTGSSGGTNGYWVLGANGAVYPFGAAPNYGSLAGRATNAPTVGMAPSADGAGYWLVGADGGVFPFGDAHYYGSTGGMRLNQPMVGMAATHDGGGYWLFAGDGGIFTFGDARYHGSTGGMRLNQPIVGMASTVDGGGYWLVAADGGIFTFGDARFYGSTGSIRLNQPIVGMVPTSNGQGYWLVGRDGGIFTFGNARYVGSLPGEGISDTVVSVTPSGDGGGYLMVSAGGRVYNFGDAPYLGDPASTVGGWSGRALGVFGHRG